MAFQFGSAVPVDQVSYGNAIQAPAPALTLDATVPQPAPQPAPQAMPQDQTGGLPDIKVSPGEAFLSMLIGGGTPGEAAQRVRQVKLRNIQDAYALRQQQVLMQALQSAPPTRQLAMLLNPGEEGKALASSDQSMLMNGGQTRNGPAGSFIAPLIGFDDKSGKGYTYLPQTGGTIQGGSLGGDFASKDGVIASGRTGEIAGRYALPETVAPGASLHPFLPGFSGPGAANGQAPPTLGGAGAGPQTAPQASAMLDAHGHLDPLKVFQTFTHPMEGGLNPSDGNGSPTNMGINQAANPDLNVRNLTPQQAAQRFAQYYKQSGAANLPPALGLVHSDTYFINPKMAGVFLQQSGGDPNMYLAMRQQWMDNLAKTNPRLAKYAGAWSNRNATLGALVSQLGGRAQGGADGSVPSEIGNGIAGATTTIVPPGDPAYRGVAPGTKLQRSPTGEITTYAKPNEADQKTVEGYMADAKQLENLAQLGDRFNALNHQTATGPLYDEHDVEIPLVHADIPLNPIAPAMRATHTDVRAMENLSNQLATAQRTAGQRLTQFEFQKYLGASPSINNPGPQNDKIIENYHTIAEQRRTYANFMSDWLAAHGSLQGADAAWKAKQGGAASGPKIRTYNPQTGALE